MKTREQMIEAAESWPKSFSAEEVANFAMKEVAEYKESLRQTMPDWLKFLVDEEPLQREDGYVTRKIYRDDLAEIQKFLAELMEGK